MNMRGLKLLLVLSLFFFTQAQGQSVGDFNLLDPTVLGSLLPQDVTNALIKSTANYTAHRPYQGATSIINYNTLDVYLETTLMKLGDDLPKALEANGLSSVSTTKVPALPAAKIHLRKAFSDRFDMGVSGLIYKGYRIYGGDFKFVLTDPEEGPSFALRLGYTYYNLPIAYTTGTTWNPEFVMSRRLFFAEPYIGTGIRYATGEVKVAKSLGAGLPTVELTRKGSAIDEYIFTGILFRIFGAQGLRMGVEGSFDFGGFHTIGMIFGLGF